jgi:3-hydroxyacyl-CoA dehydrogenase/enoyl-CoA hydratase/carnithine racemase
MLNIEVARGICTLRFDTPPLNTLTLELLAALQDTVAQAEQDPDICGVVITGGTSQFSAGADIHLFETLASRADAERLSRTFQEAFQRLEDCRKPVVAALAGNVVGGALELAMSCRLRVAAFGTRLGLPEVKLGILPGAGGTQRLPRLIGPRQALRLMLSGELVTAEAAHRWGLVDAVCAPEKLLEQCRHLLASAQSAPRTCDRVERIPASEELAAILGEAAAAAGAVRPEVVAPRAIVEAVRIGLEQSFTAGIARERDSFADCMHTAAARHKIHLFFATRHVTKLPELSGATPRPVSHAAVVGLGTMGTGIAHALLLGGLRVQVLDEQAAAVTKGVERIRVSLERRVAEGKLQPAQRDALLANLIPAAGWDQLTGVDVIIESVFEDAAIKREVLQRLERLGQEAGTILATNTSTISLAQLAEGLQRPERLIGMHFFNPAQRMPLVEIIRQPITPPDILATMVQFSRTIRKTPVVVANREGFLVSRLFVPYVQEAFELLEEGHAPRAIDQAAVEFGFPMGPLALIDMAGLDILVHTQRILQNAFPHHGGLSRIATRLVELGHLGQKSGSGVYRYELASHEPLESEVTAELVREFGQTAGVPRDGGTMAERLVLRMVIEAFRALEERVARCAADVDVATVLGLGFPDFRGGLCRYAQDLGRAPVCRQLDEFTRRYGQRYAPCGLLRTNEGV